MKPESMRPELEWDRRLEEIASAFPYPDTPAIHAAVQQRLSALNKDHRPVASTEWNVQWRRLAQVALVLLLVLTALLAVPTVRAALAQLLRIGAITIFVGETEEGLEPSPEPAVAVLPTKRASSEPGLGTGLTPTAVPDISLSTPTRLPIPTATITRAPLHGPLTLPEAEEAVSFIIRLPDAATGLGPPDEIYLEYPSDLDSLKAIILVWLNPQGLEIPRLVLYQIGVPEYGIKEVSGESLRESEVNDELAYWIEGAHLLQIPDGNGNVETRLVGNVLIWTEGRLTYRLEGAPSLVEAVRIAESLEPASGN